MLKDIFSIDLTTIVRLISMWPEPTEAEALEQEERTNPGEEWDIPEEYMLQILDIKNLKPKLEVVKFIKEFEQEQKEFFEEPLKVFEDAYTEFELDNCKILKRSLEYTLALGNILNAGSDKGQADGF